MNVQMCSMQHTEFKLRFPLDCLWIEWEAVLGTAGKERDHICHKKTLKQNRNSLHSFEVHLLPHRPHQVRKSPKNNSPGIVLGKPRTDLLRASSLPFLNWSPPSRECLEREWMRKRSGSRGRFLSGFAPSPNLCSSRLLLGRGGSWSFRHKAAATGLHRLQKPNIINWSLITNVLSIFTTINL